MKFEAATGGAVYKSIYETPDDTRRAFQSQAVAEAPGYSAHGYGLAIDIDIDATMALRNWNYKQLMEAFASCGWFCHRRDGQGYGTASQHFNFLLPSPSLYLALTEAHLQSSWSKAVEDKINDMYGASFVMTARTVQAALTKLGYYDGTVDGNFDLHGVAAVQKFQSEWCLAEDGVAGAKTQRVLSFVTADIHLEASGTITS